MKELKKDALLEAADKIKEQSMAFSKNNDGSKLGALDDLIKAVEIKGKPYQP